MFVNKALPKSQEICILYPNIKETRRISKERKLSTIRTSDSYYRIDVFSNVAGHG